MNVHGGAFYKDVINVYDSGRPITVSTEFTTSVCSLFLKCMSDKITFDIMNVSPQTNAHGVYAIAFATELVHGADPVPCSWDVEQMREHLIHCLESGLMTRFPQLTNKRTNGVSASVLGCASHLVLYCIVLAGLSMTSQKA